MTTTTRIEAGANVRNVHGIPGLSLLTGAVPAEGAARILSSLQNEAWKRWQRRRGFLQQDFGFEYDYTSRGASRTVAIPDEIKALFPAVREAGWTGPDPTQVSAILYPTGGHLGVHIDSDAFGPEVGGISLETEWPIRFSRYRQGDYEDIPLPVLSAYVMRQDARERWYHQIRPCWRGERVSLTFRTMSPGTHQPWKRKQ
ncbi:MAG: alpha-ketoglutarate-dependent dioxygenase AlkB [Acidobacteria bacterium]|nr:alpha-ketoglutarate-dependent dioxygenase AlkB [Acidobacteriota bacterium]